MADIAGSYITIEPSNIKTTKSSVQQLVDIVQVDIASSGSTNTRKSYEVFTSGSASTANITSSLFQTVHDQDFSLGTSNPLFDITIGSLLEESSTEINVNEIPSSEIARDGGGKLKGFSDTSAMMREKINIYKQFAQNILGDASSSFFLPHSATAEEALTDSNALTRNKKIRAAIFICFRRLFTRDNIYKGSFGIKLHKSAKKLFSNIEADRTSGTAITNIDAEVGVENSLLVIDDGTSITNRTVSPVSGEVATLLQGTTKVGVIFYDSGIVVLDAERVFDPDQVIRGLIDSTQNKSASASPRTSDVDVAGPFIVYGRKASESSGAEKFYYPVFTASGGTHTVSTDLTNFVLVNASGSDISPAKTFFYESGQLQNSTSLPTPSSAGGQFPQYPMYVANSNLYYNGSTVNEEPGKLLFNNKLYPNFWISGTIDNILDHVCMTRFGRDNLSSITFRNETVLNSSLIFCRASPTQFNYSTNPTYTDSDGNIIATSSNSNGAKDSFSYVTTIGLYDGGGSLLSVAKTSRPIEKNPETDLSIRIRLDY
jgi:hypothetical protein